MPRVEAVLASASFAILLILNLDLFRDPGFPHLVPVRGVAADGKMVVPEMFEYPGDRRQIEAAPGTTPLTSQLTLLMVELRFRGSERCRDAALVPFPGYITCGY
ncbi:MAG: hypothetical protein WCA28_18745 [Bradyrhizobium sp.]